MPELKTLARECRLRGYSQLRKAELIELIRNDERNTNPSLQSWEPIMGPEDLGPEGSHAPEGTQSTSSSK